jgi:hypothetical protein
MRKRDKYYGFPDVTLQKIEFGQLSWIAEPGIIFTLQEFCEVRQYMMDTAVSGIS